MGEDGVTQSFIEVSGLVKSFGGKHVLKGVDLNVEEGESLVLIGTSGSGKTLLLKCILGLIPLDRGKVIVGGEDTARYRGESVTPLSPARGCCFSAPGCSTA